MKRHGVLFSGLLNFIPRLSYLSVRTVLCIFPYPVVLVDYFPCSPTL